MQWIDDLNTAVMFLLVKWEDAGSYCIGFDSAMVKAKQKIL